jgi:coenzyme Q-binding protein COQ10
VPRFETTRPVRHSPGVMFDLVADIERYPEFVPMCESLFVKRRATDASGVTVLLADMSIGYKMIRETFTTRVELDPTNSQIRVSYIDGPFKHLENRWTFVPKAPSMLASASREPGATSPADASGCDVKFFIDYEFKSRTFQMLAGAVFEKVFRKMAEAFEARADALARASR